MPLVLTPDLSFVALYITAADSLHVARDVTTHKQTRWNTRACAYVHGNIVTQAMSAGPVVCDVISLSCSVSVLAYSQVYSSVERRAVKTGPNQPTLHLHSSLHLSSHLTLLYKIILTDIPRSDKHDLHYCTSAPHVTIGYSWNPVTD